MARQKRTQGKQEPETSGATLRDRLGKDALEKLKEASQTLRKEEEARKTAERERQAAERKAREKNKTFADLLSESSLDWKKFK